jgi:hypothetical protein
MYILDRCTMAPGLSKTGRRLTQFQQHLRQEMPDFDDSEELWSFSSKNGNGRKCR